MQHASNPKVSIVILNWNNFRDTTRCIESALSCGYRHLEVIVVDNSSTDGSVERIASQFPGLQIVRNESNLGFSRGCNRGIQAALKDPQCRFVLLLNNDCTLQPGGLVLAVRAMTRSSDIGVVTGKVYFGDGSRRIWHAGGRVSLFAGQAVARGFREIDIGQFDNESDTGWASGAMMLVSREVLAKVGMLPEEYFFGVEEWDYSLAVLRNGFRIRYVPTFVGFHSGGGSHHNHDPKFVYNYYRNKLIFQQRQLGTFLFYLWLIPFRTYLNLRMRRHVQRIVWDSYPDEHIEIDDVVFAAQRALGDHGKNRLSESTMLEFDATLKAWKDQVRPSS